jgi:hypothetical protein
MLEKSPRATAASRRVHGACATAVVLTQLSDVTMNFANMRPLMRESFFKLAA